MSSKLYQPLKLGATTIANRMIMAPLTRCRSDNATHMPNELMAEYYGQRATAGLVITECTMVSPMTSAFYTEPGIYNDKQSAAWKTTTEAVHKKGGKIFLQIWHGGRASTREYNDGKQPVAPSAVAITQPYMSALQKGAQVPNDVPRALTDDEAKNIVKDFADAAKRAISAGFDGVEVHGANGYLVNQFLVPHGNQRGAESRYSGATIETRSRFALDVVDAVNNAIGGDRVGIRLSPYVLYNNATWENPEKDAAYIAKELDKRQIAYLHIERRDMFTPDRDTKVDITSVFRDNFTHKGGSILSNIDFEREEAELYVDSGKADAIVFGVPLLANPDLVRRFKEQRPERNAPDKATFYTPGPKGYTDYAFL